tara:strand:- start:1821 stop:2132 length:312 start_codon:yes stop_codon:yes gene_type:complete
MKLILVITNMPDFDSAKNLGSKLVDLRLAACINIIPGIKSIYRWESKVVQENEVMLFIKTSEEKYPILEEKILKMHPYDTPEIIGLPLENVTKKYSQWILSEI